MRMRAFTKLHHVIKLSLGIRSEDISKSRVRRNTFEAGEEEKINKLI